MRVARLRPRADRASGAGAGSWRAAMLPTFGKGTRHVRGAGGQPDARPGQRAARRRNAPAGAASPGIGARHLRQLRLPAAGQVLLCLRPAGDRSEEHTSELHSLMRISYAVFCLKKKINYTTNMNHLKE